MGSVLCGFLTLVVTSRVLGPEGRGVVTTITSILLLVPIVASFGLPMSVRRVFATSDKSIADLGLGAAKALGIPIGIAGSVVALVIGALTSGGLSRSDLMLGVAVGVCTVTGIWWLSDGNALLGQGRVGAYATVLLLPSLLLATLIAILVAGGWLTVESTIAAQVLAYAMTSAYSGERTRVAALAPLVEQGRALRTSFQYFGGQVAEALSYRLDQALAIVFLGAAGAGHYSIAATIGMLPSTLGLAVSAATFNEVARNPMVDGRPNLTAVRVAFLAALPAMCLTAACAPMVIPVMFGDDFRPAVVATVVALVGSQFLVLAQGAASLLLAQGMGWKLSVAQLAGLAIGLLFLAVLGPTFGVVGASVASSLGFATAAILSLVFLKATFADLCLRREDARSVLATFTTGRL